MKYYVLVSYLLLCLFAKSQDFNNYTPIKAQGSVPSDFTTLSMDKVDEQRSEIDDSERRSVRKSKERFLQGSNYMINRLLSSGRVIFNDPVSEYLGKILDELLKNEPDLRRKVRIYAVKSSSVNAFATNNGIIMVNLGLIAQLETEAQLAYILSHELVHYMEGHVMDVYLENEKIERGKGGYRGTSISEKVISSSNYSKETESEADLKGYELFEKSSYGTGSLEGVFDVLHYAYLPFDDIEFAKDFFEDEYFKLPEEYFLEEVTPFSPFDEEDDSRSSHPSTLKRKKEIKAKISANSNDGLDYLLTEGKFRTIRKMCRFELSELYYQNFDFELAIYNSYMLLKDNPDSKYLKSNIAKSLYNLAKFSNHDQFYEVHTRYKKIEGSSQQVYHLFEKMKKLTPLL